MTETATPTVNPGPPPGRKRRRRALIAAQVGLGLTLGLALAEFAFTARAEGAFPHVNFYVPDADRGARLEPGAHMAFKLGDNPRTEIHVNAQGYRGADWPAASDGRDEVLVVGDSQVFGLGVDDDETFSAVLAAQTGQTVLNAGVPTYGPPEYFAVAEELTEDRPVATVVYVLNFLNDPFELDRLNRDRHAIWDGWAVRIETAPKPEDIVAFPGRRWLMSRSHLVYAARRYWHSRDEGWFSRVDRGLPSEGRFDELLSESDRAHAALRTAEDQAADARDNLDQRAERIQQGLAEVAEDRQRYQDEEDYTPRKHYDDDDVIAARPGGIIRDRYSESSRSIEVTAEMYRAALASRRARQVEAAGVLDRLRTRERKLLTDLERTAKLPAPEVPDRPASVFDAHFATLAELEARHGVRVIVVLLPFDVQVSSEEWSKYGVTDGPDMSGTLVLLDDAAVSARAHGLEVLDASAALREAEPGAFLDADIHMTPKGHAALAEALAALLDG